MSTNTLILGGGFGGLATANMLRRLLPAQHAVTVVDRSPRFHVGAGKPWIVLGEKTCDEISAERGRLLEPGIELLQADIRRIDVPGGRIDTAAGPRSWDFLVIALGAALRQEAIPGLPAAHTFYSVEGAEKLRPAIAAFTAGAIVLVVPKKPYKCPAAPWEMAMLLHHHFAQRGLSGNVGISAYTVEDAPMATGGSEMSALVRGELARRDIGFFPRKEVMRVDDTARRVNFADGTSVPYDLLLCVPPHEAPAVVREAKLLGPSGWIPVDPQTLALKSGHGAGRVFAIGDVSGVQLPGRFKADVPLSLPKAGTIAAAQGEVVARRIADTALGRAPSATFSGRGFCYLETGGGEAVRGDGSFFALPHPVMEKQKPTAALFAHKLAWVAQQLTPRR